MNRSSRISQTAPADGYEVCFRSLFDAGRALSFPCDAQGQVQLDALSARARLNYFYARTVVGRDFASPEVHATCREDRAH